SDYASATRAAVTTGWSTVSAPTSACAARPVTGTSSWSGVSSRRGWWSSFGEAIRRSRPPRFRRLPPRRLDHPLHARRGSAGELAGGPRQPPIPAAVARTGDHADRREHGDLRPHGHHLLGHAVELRGQRA